MKKEVEKKEELLKICKEALDYYPDKVNNYKLGKTGLIGLFVGEVMKRTNNSEDPKKVIAILKRLLR